MRGLRSAANGAFGSQATRVGSVMLVLAAACSQPARDTGDSPPVALTSAQDSAELVCKRRNLRVTRLLQPDGTPSRLGVSKFGSLLDAGVDRRGRFYLLDAANRFVTVFDSTGQHVDRLPLPGDRYSPTSIAVGMSVTESGTIYLWDTLQQTLFAASIDSDSVFRRLRTIFGEATPGRPIPIIAHDSTGIAVPLRRQHGNSVRDEVRLYNANGRLIVNYGPYPTTSVALVRADKNGPLHKISLPFDLADRVVWHLRPDGSLLLANSAKYHVIALRGADTLWALSRTVDAVPVGRKDRDNVSVMAPSVSARENLANLIPHTKVPITGLAAIDDVLLVRRPTSSEHVYAGEFDLFDLSDRSFCGSLSLPVYEAVGRGHWLVGRVIGNDGTVSVTAFRLTWTEQRPLPRRRTEP